MINNDVQQSRPKISHKTLYSNFENGGLNLVDISSNILNLQCSWLRKLCDQNSYEWKKSPSHLINKYFGKSCVYFDCKLHIQFSEFYENILFQGSSFLFFFRTTFLYSVKFSMV